jgi:hypothetical protein
MRLVLMQVVSSPDLEPFSFTSQPSVGAGAWRSLYFELDG